MTAEIAILNRSAVALAADSAVTIGEDRVWKHTNKLFSMSSSNDIGIMIYGSGDFCGISWEIVIKQFRKHIGKRRFKKLSESIEEFKVFLNKFITPNEDISNISIYQICISTIYSCSKKVSASGKLKRRRQFIGIAEKLADDADEFETILPNLTRETFKKKFSKSIRGFLEEEMKVHVTNQMHSKVIDVCFERTRRSYASSFVTGVVFAGYGSDEILPSIVELNVDGRYTNTARIWIERKHDLNKALAPAIVMPFAQSDIAYLFMEGMQLEYLKFIENTLAGVLEQKSERLVDQYVAQANRVVENATQTADNKVLVKAFMREFGKMRQEDVIKPMLKVIASLPKEEMAAMAESLVEITSLRRKIDSKVESVGGPVDVAVVSKADGFVWIKRKHYFDLELNHDFMVRRTLRFEGD
ncbi:hypothetical protein [Phyllobacterium sp. P5_D12]